MRASVVPTGVSACMSAVKSSMEVRTTPLAASKAPGRPSAARNATRSDRSSGASAHILMVDDEVMAGFGRTGRMFAIEHWGVVPDLMTMAKGLTSSYVPLGAVGMRRAIADHFQTNVFWGGLTYNSHPLACAAALAVIDTVEAEGLVGHAAEMEVLLREELESLSGVREVFPVVAGGCMGAKVGSAVASEVATLRLGELTATAPFRYSVMVFAIISGILVFGEFPDWIAILGMVLIVVCGLYAAHREALRAKALSDSAGMQVP